MQASARLKGDPELGADRTRVIHGWFTGQRRIVQKYTLTSSWPVYVNFPLAINSPGSRLE